MSMIYLYFCRKKHLVSSECTSTLCNISDVRAENVANKNYGVTENGFIRDLRHI